jgi:hypothetical protein
MDRGLLHGHGNERLAHLYALLDEGGEVPLRPVRGTSGVAASVNKCQDGQWSRYVGESLLGWRHHIQRQTFRVAEGILWAWKSVLQQNVLHIASHGVGHRQRALWCIPWLAPVCSWEMDGFVRDELLPGFRGIHDRVVLCHELASCESIFERRILDAQELVHAPPAADALHRSHRSMFEDDCFCSHDSSSGTSLFNGFPFLFCLFYSFSSDAGRRSTSWFTP